ncbi:MAG: hypothetical protein RIQ56_864 [Candidatus Parcubacteria bacterium]|jgi:hypothetical protein
MRSLLWIGILAVFLPLQSHAVSAARCQYPVNYYIGNIDPRFNLSQADVSAAAHSAATLWENAVGKELFAEGPSSKAVAVHFVYDSRQNSQDNSTSDKNALETESLRMEQINSALKQISSALSGLGTVIDREREMLQNETSSYESDVRALNTQGGGTTAQLNSYELRRIAIENKRNALTQKSLLYQEIIQMLKQLSSIATSQNESLQERVAAFNSLTNTAKDTVSGEYTEDGYTRTLRVYQFASQQDLHRTLAHELGHALGLGHVFISGSLMSLENNGLAPAITSADLKEFYRVCGL